MNDITEHLFYGQRMIISAPIEEPITWRITKVSNINPKGINRITFAQTLFDPLHDFIERDEDGLITGMWASYYTDGVPVVEHPGYEPITNEYAVITYSGSQKPQLRVNGNYKTFSVTFYDERGDIDYKSGYWDFRVDGSSALDLIKVITSSEDQDLKENQIRIKFIGDDSYISNDLVISYTSDTGVRSELIMNIVGI